MFDGCFMPKKGCYFLCYGDSLFDYHTNRLKVFGEVPTNYIEKKTSTLFFVHNSLHSFKNVKNFGL